MTLSIHLNFDTGNLSSEEANGLAALLDAVRPSLPTAKELAQRYATSLYAGTALTASQAINAPYGSGVQTQPPVDNDHVAEGATQFTETEVSANAPKRERGQPSPGKARRTKAEIAEDDAADAADAARGPSQAEQDALETEIPPEGSAPVAEDDAATQAQDAADEQAEVDAARDPENPLTVDDLKAAYLPYFEKYGMEATKEDGAKMFVEIFGPVPEGSNGWTTAAMVEQGQDKVRQAIDGWARLAAENPHGRKPVK